MGYLGTKPANAVVTSEQLADGVVSTADIANSAITRAKMGYAGAVLQVVQGTYATETTSATKNSWVATNLTASITPTSSSSKVLILVGMSDVGFGAADSGVAFALYKGASSIYQGASQYLYDNSSSNFRILSGYSLQYLDSPATTSSTTYTLYYNWKTAGSASLTTFRDNTRGTITLLEIAA